MYVRLLVLLPGNSNDASGTKVKSAEVKSSVACFEHKLMTWGRHMMHESFGLKSISWPWSRCDSSDMVVLLLLALLSVK